MKQISLTEQSAESIRSALHEAGYLATERNMYVRYTKERGDSVFIHHSLDVIRARRDSEASKIIERFLGAANGKAPESQDDGKSLSWFLNGYQGKSTTRV